MSNKPKIRFKGFTDDWEQRKLGNVLDISRGGSPRPIDTYIKKSKNGLNWIKIGDAPKLVNSLTPQLLSCHNHCQINLLALHLGNFQHH